MWRVSTSIVAVATLESPRKTAAQRDWSYRKAVWVRTQVCQWTQDDFLSCRFPNLPRNPVQLSNHYRIFFSPKPCSLISCKMRPTWHGWWEHAFPQVAYVACDGIRCEGIINAQSRVMNMTKPNYTSIASYASVSLKIRRIHVYIRWLSLIPPLHLLQDLTWQLHPAFQRSAVYIQMISRPSCSGCERGSTNKAWLNDNDWQALSIDV